MKIKNDEEPSMLDFNLKILFSLIFLRFAELESLNNILCEVHNENTKKDGHFFNTNIFDHHLYLSLSSSPEQVIFVNMHFLQYNCLISNASYI